MEIEHLSARPLRGCCASMSNGAEILRASTTASPICRIDTSPLEDGWRRVYSEEG